MKCPYCSHMESKVVDSRPTEDGNVIRRRRECFSCAKRFTTYEKVEDIPLMVVKKAGHREPFDRNKILNGILRACEKRPVSMAQVETIVNAIETEVYQSADREIQSKEVGEHIMLHLKDLDEVAYVRFASVYRQFKDLNTFMEELNKLMKENNPV